MTPPSELPASSQFIRPLSAGWARSNLAGAAALAVSIFSAGMVVATLSILQENARWVESLPPGEFSGGLAFSVNFNLSKVVLLSIGGGVIAFVLLVLSLLDAREMRRRLLTTVHIGAGICILPSVYLFLTFVLHFIQLSRR